MAVNTYDVTCSRIRSYRNKIFGLKPEDRASSRGRFSYRASRERAMSSSAARHQLVISFLAATRARRMDQMEHQ